MIAQLMAVGYYDSYSNVALTLLILLSLLYGLPSDHKSGRIISLVGQLWNFFIQVGNSFNISKSGRTPMRI